MSEFKFTGTVGGSGAASATINVVKRSATQVAPDGFIFGVTVSGFDAAGPSGSAVYDNRWHDLYYTWDFGDAYTFMAPQNTTAASRNANVAYGPMASHTYRAAGTYTVSVTVHEPASGKSATGTLQVTVGSPDTLFTGGQTLFVSPSSDWTNAPAGAGHYTSFDAAIAAAKGSGTTPKRIMLNRGEAYSMATVDFGANDATIHIVAGPGNGVKPAVTVASGHGFQLDGLGASKDFVLQSLQFTGSDDSRTSDTTVSPYSFRDFIRTVGSAAPGLLLLDGVESRQWSHHIHNAAYNGASKPHRHTILNDSVFENFTAWCVYDNDKMATALVGCRIMAHVDAPVDATPGQGAPYRGGEGDLIVQSCDWFSRQGWTQHGPNALASQHCLRFNSAGRVGARLTVHDCTFEGGHGVMAFKISNASDTSNPVNAVVDSNYFLGDYQTYSIFHGTMSGITIRNNIAVFPASTRIANTNPPRWFLDWSEDNSGGTNVSEPVKAYNNTVVNLSSSGDGLGLIRVPPGWAGMAAENNIIYEPNIGSPVTGDAPLETSPPMFTPRGKGYFTRANPTPVAGTTTPINTPTTFKPQTGSAAIDSATSGLRARTDFGRAIRPSPSNRGAWE